MLWEIKNYTDDEGRLLGVRKPVDTAVPCKFEARGESQVRFPGPLPSILVQFFAPVDAVDVSDAFAKFDDAVRAYTQTDDFKRRAHEQYAFEVQQLRGQLGPMPGAKAKPGIVDALGQPLARK